MRDVMPGPKAALSVALLVAVTQPACSSTASPWQCIEQLVAPVYPHIAAAARTSATGIQATVKVESGKGQLVDLVVPDGTPLPTLYGKAVEEAVHRSRFSQRCDGAPVKLEYSFVLAEPPNDPPSTQRASFQPPNQIIVSITGAVIDTSGLK